MPSAWTPERHLPMPVPRRSLFLPAALLWAITLSAWAPVSALAQAASKSATAPADSGPDDDGKPVAFLGVSVNLDTSGKANVQASYYLADKPNLPPAEIKEALQSALGCTLQNFPRFRPVPGLYAGSCT